MSVCIYKFKSINVDLCVYIHIDLFAYGAETILIACLINWAAAWIRYVCVYVCMYVYISFTYVCVWRVCVCVYIRTIGWQPGFRMYVYMLHVCVHTYVHSMLHELDCNMNSVCICICCMRTCVCVCVHT
jgi:hypothetical protein